MTANGQDDVPAGPLAAPSTLSQLMDMIREATNCDLNFEDLTGISYHCPDLNLPERLRIHTCTACMFAKSKRKTHVDCINNKIAANRIAMRRRRTFSGMCHIGLNEMVAPLILNGNVLGVFYCGSVLVVEHAAESRNRLKTYCKRRDLELKEFQAAFHAVPKLKKSAFVQMHSKLELLVEVAKLLVMQSGLPIDAYATKKSADRLSAKQIPPLVQAAARYIERNHGSAISLQDIANHLHCTPHYVSRCFSRHFPEGITGYLRKVRMDHAVKLIRSGRYSMGEISFMVGLSDQSYFTKIFRETFGCSPGKFRDSQWSFNQDNQT